MGWPARGAIGAIVLAVVSTAGLIVSGSQLWFVPLIVAGVIEVVSVTIWLFQDEPVIEMWETVRRGPD